MSRGLNTEIELSKLRNKLSGKFHELKIYFDQIDSPNLCNYALPTYEEIKSTYNFIVIECETVSSRLVTLGFNSLIIKGINYAKKTDAIFQSQYSPSNQSYANMELTSKEIVENSIIAVNLDDLRIKYTEYIEDKSIENLNDVLRNWTQNQSQIHNIKFSLYITLLVIVFIFIWKRMVSNMRMDITKALGILNVLPTSHLCTNIAFIKLMNHSNLMN